MIIDDKDIRAIELIRAIDLYINGVIHTEKSAENALLTDMLVKTAAKIAEKHNIKIL